MLDLSAACHEAAQQNLILSSSGNFSQRLGPNMLITESGAYLGSVKKENLSEVNIETGQVLTGKPSSELTFHRGIYLKRPEIQTVFHFQSPYATTIACSDRLPNFNVIPEIPGYIGEIGWIPYYTPGSQALAGSVIEVMVHCNMGVMRNHGLVTVGESLKQVLQRATFFELACQIIVLQRNPKHISKKECQRIRELCSKRV